MFYQNPLKNLEGLLSLKATMGYSKKLFYLATLENNDALIS
jgi:hypothetical protein